jgi:hypothetical protein
MLIRLIIFFILIYLAVKLLKNLLKAPTQKLEIKGSPKNRKPLDLSNADIEDADFEEINED